MTTWTKETVDLAIATDSLTVDNIKIDGSNIGHTDDTDLLALASDTLTVNGAIAGCTSLEVGTITNSATNLTLDSSGDIALNADGGDVTIADGSAADAWKFNAASRILRCQHDDNNYFSIRVQDNGVTTLSSYDEGMGFAGNMLISADGSNEFRALLLAKISGTTGIELDSAMDITFDADGDHIMMKFGGATGQIDFTNENSGDGVIQQKVNAKDLVIKQYDGTEVARFKDNLDVVVADDLILASDKKLYLDGGTSEALVYDSGTDTIRLYTGPSGHYTTLTSPYNENSNAVYGKNAGAGMHSANVNNTFIGDDVASTGTMTSGSTNNTGVGTGALKNMTSGYQNTAVGQDALNDLTEGYHNTALGRDAASSLTTGNYNTCLGWHAGKSIVSDHSNVHVGRNAGAAFASSGGDTSTYNTTIGSYAGEHWTTGTKNTLVGAQAGNGTGNPTTGSSNIMIGWHADPSADGTDNEIVIGTNATGKGANKAVIGHSSCTDVYMAQDSGASVHCTSVTLKETTTPTALADHGKIYTKSDNKLYFQNGDGTEKEIQFV
jgi:hypothetical protein